MMVIVHATWRKSYEQIVEYMTNQEALALELGFTHQTAVGKLQTISKGQYCERRGEMGLLPFVFFFRALVSQFIRQGIITCQELIVDSTLPNAWYQTDPEVT